MINQSFICPGHINQAVKYSTRQDEQDSQALTAALIKHAHKKTSTNAIKWLNSSVYMGQYCGLLDIYVFKVV